MPSGVYIKSELHKQKISDSLKKKHKNDVEFHLMVIERLHTPENRMKMAKTKTGVSTSTEYHKQRTTETHTGNKYNVGRTHTEEHKEIAASRLRGDKNHNWKGGVSRGYKTGYYSAAYKNWRKDIFSRDNYTCQECGANNCYLTAHHIKSFAKFPELRLDIKNGLTLCEDCHKKTDNYKGKNKRRKT